MSKIKCVIIDDEPLAMHILEEFIGEVDTMDVVATFYNAIDALMYLQQHKVDLLFLDVQLPLVTGSNFLQLIPSRPKIIYLTNKRNPKVLGADENVLGFLMRPVSFENFLACITKYYTNLPPGSPWPTAIDPHKKKEDPFIYVRSEKKMVKLYLKDILYVEGINDFLRIKTTGRDIVIYQRIGYLYARLPRSRFVRLHRSFIVARDKITAYNESMVQVNRHILPVSRQYRKRVLTLLDLKV